MAIVRVLTSQQEDDPQLATPAGGPRQFFLVAIDTGGGGGQISVPNIAALEALDVTALPQGAIAYVVTVGAYWTLQPPSFAVPTTRAGVPTDGITVVPASNGGVWLRSLSGVQEWAIVQTSWTVSAATGNDENDGSPGAPLATFSEIARRMGTWNPRIDQDVTITVLDAPSLTDVYQFVPYGSGSFAVVFPVGAPQQVATGTLAGVVAKNTAHGVGQPLAANVYPGAAVGQMVRNTTRGSVAFVMGAGETQMVLSQPYQQAVPPTTPLNPPADNGWTSGDSFEALALVPFHALKVGWQTTDFSGNASHRIFNCTFFAANGFEPTFLFEQAQLTECAYQGEMVIPAVLNTDILFSNVSAGGVGFGEISGGQESGEVFTFIRGGGHFAMFLAGADLSGVALLFNGSTGANFEYQSARLVDVMVDSTCTAVISGHFCNASLVWGLGTLNVRAATLQGNGAAVGIFPVSVLQMDNLSQAWATSSSGGVVTWNGPRALTAALLDTPVAGGGFLDATALGTSGYQATNGKSCITSLPA